jgi:hypothetical protein
MRGFLKAASVILKCTHPRCGCLRDTTEAGFPCMSCLARGVLWRWTRVLPLADIADDTGDASPIETFLTSLVGQMENHE